MIVVNRTRGAILGTRVRTASTFPRRLKGLLGTSALAEGEGLWITPCAAVHTVGMRYPLDVLYLDDGGKVIGVISALAPNRVARRFREAAGALELPAGMIDGTGTVLGDRVEFLDEVFAGGA